MKEESVAVQKKDLGVEFLDIYNVWAIFRNPEKLEYNVTVYENERRFGLSIEDKDGVLYSSGPVTSSMMNVLDINKTVLSEILKKVDMELQDNESVTSQIFNRDGKVKNRVTFLSETMIEEIIEKKKQELTVM